MHLQTSTKKTIQDTAETTVDLVEKKKCREDYRGCFKVRTQANCLRRL